MRRYFSMYFDQQALQGFQNISRQFSSITCTILFSCSSCGDGDAGENQDFGGGSGSGGTNN